MNKLLRNPWVVGALVLGMAALWWVQMRSIFFPGGVVSTEPSAPAAVVSEVTQDATTSVDVVSVDASNGNTLTIEPISETPRTPTQLRWEHSPVRDPFGPVAVAAPQVSVPDAPVPVVEAPVLETVPALPMLEAVLSTPSAQIAVIDGHMVRVGDKVSGRPVLKIDPTSVALGRGADAAEPLLLRLPVR